jgi:excisionase family DNA binding protein
MDNGKLLTVQEAAKFLDVAPSTLYMRVQENRIPFVRLWAGKRKNSIRFTMESLQEFVRANTVQVAGR